ncbi:polysaccharide deacetylase family protein [Mucilaginibacter ginsenosidivorax]|uniref:Polysaccharide deacetylase family protein n=1 Tax=Mucilaginibacter ginsenosidivorax TaxID=862126 RepID=A0A5B8W6S1_9SPHI|nr:polysaccharide deacetylase family protein [Mucilaginibacter ginsenosidivorax]QEC77948.1 polysaccharide deacetylase family protein [Mucilaginibacter ginsenosidivorax]
MKKLVATLLLMPLFINCLKAQPGKTEITKWQYGRNGAVSITWDDGSVNQFKVALPILNRLGIKSTFFIITGQIPGSQYQAKFIGRPLKQIIAETATTLTNKDNFYERASAAGHLGLIGTLDYHYKAGSLIDDNKPDAAYKVIDELYSKVRQGDFKPGMEHNTEYNDAHGTTWAQIKQYAAQGHEFASHMVTHPRLAALDEPNMLYEMEKSRLDILHKLGLRYTFSAEGPFGTENERAVSYLSRVYPALRNRMPEPWLKEISRGNKDTPGNTGKAYVQYQRGATTKTPLPMMKAWVDTTMNRNDTWLVLTHHGVQGIGWEALPATELDEYFTYIKNHEDKLWIATFGDVTKYMRERQSANLTTGMQNGKLVIKVSHPLDKRFYNIPLTLKTCLPAGWKNVRITQNGKVVDARLVHDKESDYVLYQVKINTPAIITKL